MSKASAVKAARRLLELGKRYELRASCEGGLCVFKVERKHQGRKRIHVASWSAASWGGIVQRLERMAQREAA